MPVCVCARAPADLLGGMSVGYNGNTPFIDHTGAMQPVASLIVTETDGVGYPKIVTKVKTPKLLSVIRAQYNCSTMSGLTLEDIPMAGGYGVHWEARLTGPEVHTHTHTHTLRDCVGPHPCVHVCPRAAHVIWHRLRGDVRV